MPGKLHYIYIITLIHRGAMFRLSGGGREGGGRWGGGEIANHVFSGPWKGSPQEISPSNYRSGEKKALCSTFYDIN